MARLAVFNCYTGNTAFRLAMPVWMADVACRILGFLTGDPHDHCLALREAESWVR